MQSQIQDCPKEGARFRVKCHVDAIQWGGVVAGFFRDLKADAIQWGGGSSRNFPWYPKDYAAIRGGVVGTESATEMVAILSKWLSSIFGDHTSMCNCTILITSSTLITSSIHKKTNGTYSMTLMVNTGHFSKWPPNLLRGQSLMPPYPKLFRMY